MSGAEGSTKGSARVSKKLIVSVAVIWALVVTGAVAIGVIVLTGDDGDDGNDGRADRGPSATDDASREPDNRALEDFYDQEIAWQACGEDECGTLEVPVDYADPSGDTLTLSIARVPAGDEDQRIGPLFVNPGGPGGTAGDFAITMGMVLPDEITDRSLAFINRHADKPFFLEVAFNAVHWPFQPPDMTPAPASVGLVVSRRAAVHAFTTDRTMDIYRRSVMGAYRLFVDAGVMVEFVHEDQIEKSGIPGGLSTLYFPMPSVVSQALAARLDAWVGAGGRLVSDEGRIVTHDVTEVNRQLHERMIRLTGSAVSLA